MKKFKDPIPNKLLADQTKMVLAQEDKSKTSLSAKDNKTQLNLLSGSLTGILLGWLSLRLSQRILLYFSSHSFNLKSSLGLSISIALKTLTIGMVLFATFSFTFIGLGLLMIFIRNLIWGEDHTTT